MVWLPFEIEADYSATLKSRLARAQIISCLLSVFKMDATEGEFAKAFKNHINFEQLRRRYNDMKDVSDEA